MVRGSSVRDRGRLQAVCGELPGDGPPAANPGRRAGHRREDACSCHWVDALPSRRPPEFQTVRRMGASNRVRGEIDQLSRSPGATRSAATMDVNAMASSTTMTSFHIIHMKRSPGFIDDALSKRSAISAELSGDAEVFADTAA